MPEASEPPVDTGSNTEHTYQSNNRIHYLRRKHHGKNKQAAESKEEKEEKEGQTHWKRKQTIGTVLIQARNTWCQ